MLPHSLFPRDIRSIKYRKVASSLTFDLGLETKESHWRLNKKIDAIKALEQSIRKRLETKQGAHEIYSPLYGLSLTDLIGRPTDYVKSEIKQRISDNLLLDDRIVALNSFSFPKTKDKKVVAVFFVVESIWGSLDMEVQLHV